MQPNRIHLTTSLTPRQCASAIAAALEVKPGRVAGDVVTESTLQLRMRRGRTLYPIFLTATLRAEADKTLISGKVGIPAISRVLLFLWCSMPILFAIASAGEWAVVGQLLLVGGLFWGGVWLCRFIARDDRQLLVDFVAKATNALHGS